MVKRLMNELAGITVGYGRSESAYPNPAAPLLYTLRTMSGNRRMVANLRNGNINNQQGITLTSPENGFVNNPAAAISFLPGGYRNNNNGNFNNLGNNGNFWSATENNTNNAWRRKLNYNNTEVNRNNNNKQNGYSVRCIRDLEFNIIGLLPFLYEKNYAA